MQKDKTIDEVREARHQISKTFDHDPRKLVQHYLELQKKHDSKLIYAPEKQQGPVLQTQY